MCNRRPLERLASADALGGMFLQHKGLLKDRSVDERRCAAAYPLPLRLSVARRRRWDGIVRATTAWASHVKDPRAPPRSLCFACLMVSLLCFEPRSPSLVSIR